MTIEQINILVKVSKNLKKCLDELGETAQQLDNNAVNAVMLKAEILNLCNGTSQQMADILTKAADIIMA